jgi:hypothetical protein
MKYAENFFSEILEISANIIKTTEEAINSKQLNGTGLSESELNIMTTELAKVKEKNIELFNKINELNNANSNNR